MADPKSKTQFSPVVDATRVKQVAVNVFYIDVRGLELTSGRHAIELSNWSLPDGKRALSAFLPGSREDARFEIGEIQVDHGDATLVLFGPPTFEPDTLVF